MDAAKCDIDATYAVNAARDFFESGRTRDIQGRRDELARLREGIREHTEELCAALEADLGKQRHESMLTEISVVLAEIDHVSRHLDTWLRPGQFSIGATLLPGSGTLVREPLGAVLVIAPWNYPVSLALSPLIGAIAGGNAAVLKPSEVAPHTSEFLATLIREHVTPGWVQVVEGGVDQNTALLEQRWDLIFFTGSTAVGRIVAEAAARHLTPTILELGGKSPVFVDEGMDLNAVARRIAWGKFANAGQTCVAPDYVLATAPVLHTLEKALMRQVARMYGRDPQKSPGFGRMITESHARRVAALIDPAKVVCGGESDPRARYIAPTILRGVTANDACMQEEIFGPVLPLVEVSGVDEAIAFINEGEKPLTLYVFSERPEVEQAFVERTSSGSVALGLTLAHVGCVEMPFGGVGESGMGAYHGRASVEAFTHLKPVVKKPLKPDTLRLVYPPYGPVATLAHKIRSLRVLR